MPINLKKSSLKYKDHEGNMQDLGLPVGGIITDITLTKLGVSADAKATGEKISHLEATVNDLKENGVGSSVEPADDDIPKVYFTGALPSSKNDGELPLSIHYKSKTEEFDYYATLKVQGGSSVNYAKKNFTLKMYEDEALENKVKREFKNWGKLNKWVLKSHWIDHSHVRNVGTAKIWGKIVKSRSDYDSLPEELRNSPNNGATDGFAVKVFANGVYQGLYEWIVPKDKLFGQDSDIVTHSIMNSESNNQTTCAFATTTPTINGNWSEELQDSMSSDISTSFANFIKFVAGSTDAEFVANAESFFDVQSVIDFDIFARVFCIVDNLCRNQIFFTYDGQKWYEGCWDVDAVLGLPPTTRGFFSYNTEFQTGYIAYKDFGMTNILYQRVEKNFFNIFKDRYLELRSSVLSVENIIEVYERLTDVITTFDGLLKEDYASTTGDGKFTSIPYTSENNIQQIRNFVAQRIVYMDEVINNMIEPIPCTGITLDTSSLTFEDGTAQTLVATVEPTNTTDTVLWESSNTGIAIVSGGVVTPIANGECVITAKCGEHSVSCDISITGINTYYTVTNTLFNCTNSNSLTTVVEGSSYSAKIVPNEGYTLSNIVVTHDGESVPVTNGSFTIDNVKGNIVINASATEIEEVLTYSLPNATTFDGTDYIDTGIAIMSKDRNMTLAYDFLPNETGNVTNGALYRFGEYRCVYNGSAWVVYNGQTYCSIISHADIVRVGGVKVVITHEVSSGVFNIKAITKTGEATSLIGDGKTSTVVNGLITPQNVYIGNNQGNGDAYNFKGVVSDFRIESRVWTDEEISAYLTV